LLFTFYKSVLNLFYVCQSSCLFNGVESLINNLHVSLIVINELNFFLVVEDEFGQSIFQNRSSVILNGLNFSSFDSAGSVELGVFELFI
jgi:hypothetical protein